MHKVGLHVGAPAIHRVLAGRMEVELQQLPPLAADLENVPRRYVDLSGDKRTASCNFAAQHGT